MVIIMNKKNMNRIYLWSHYALLTGVVFVSHHYSAFLEEKVVNAVPGAWIMLFIWYMAWIGLGDILIHKIFHKVFGWKD